MNESVRDLLRQGAGTVERPRLDVDLLVAEAERRMFRRRLAVVVASAVAVTVIVAGAVALGPGTRRSAPPPPPPAETPVTVEPGPVPGSTIYFAALTTADGTLTDPDVKVYPKRTDVYAVREGEPVRRLIATDKNERCPAVSPDGARLAYLEGAALVVRGLDPTGSPEAIDLRVDVSRPSCPQWSPDGRRLAVASQGPHEERALRVVELDGSERVLVRLGVGATPPDFAWSPEGNTIAYTTQDAVWSAPVGGGAPELLWRGTATPDPSRYGLPLRGAPIAMALSSTGRLAVSVFPDGEVHVVDPATGREQTLGRAQDPALGWGRWSPDGTQFAFAGKNARLVVYDITDGGARTTLRPELGDVGELSIYDVAWSPDGDRLLAGVARHPASSGAAFALVSMNPDGTSVEVLTPWANALYWTYMDQVSWSPR